MVRKRSPKSPVVGLRDAIQYVGHIYNGAGQTKVDPDVVYELMGFSGKSGRSAGILGALRQFGLLGGLRGDVQVSDLAMALIYPKSAVEFSDALMTAAGSVELYAELFSKYGANVPASDAVLISFLVRGQGFTAKGADIALKAFRDTLVCLEEGRSKRSEDDTFSGENVEEPLGGGVRANIVADIESIGPTPVEGSIVASNNRMEQDAGIESMRFRVSKGVVAEVNFYGEVSQPAVENLIQYLELMKLNY